MMDSYQAEMLHREVALTNTLLHEMILLLQKIERNQPNPLDHDD